MAQSPAKPNADDLAKQMETLRADVAKLTETLADLTRAEAHEVADSVKKAARRARSELEHEVDRLQVQASQAIDHADALIRDKPALAMGLAAGLGLLAGLLISRRH